MSKHSFNSMTGFGKGAAICPANQIRFTIEITSVNRKQLEIRASLARELAGYEPLLRKMVADKISRGTINIRAEISRDDNSPTSSAKINRVLLENLFAGCRDLQKQLGLQETLKLSDLLTVPGVIEPVLPDIHLPEMEDAFASATSAALDALMAMRRQEGETLRQDLAARLKKLCHQLSDIESGVAQLPMIFREKLRERLNAAGASGLFNDEALLREVVMYADRADVTEEIVRLKSHFSQFEHFLHGAEPCPGRSLDFLVQELFREINTLGNKAGGCNISPIVVGFKAELEKIREQIQNIE